MKLVIAVTLIIISSLCALSQPSIDIYLTTHPYYSKGSIIKSIEENYELMIKDLPTRPYKIIMTFNKDGGITSQIKYGSTGGILSETKWEYNENRNPIKKSHRYFLNMLGWRTEETTLHYNDTTGYISEIRFVKNGILQSTSMVFCDSLGKPIEVRVLDDKGAFTMIEKIGYSPNVNIIRVMILKATSQFISRWIYPIDSSKPYQSGLTERWYYPDGEVMLESLENQTKIDQGYYYEYSLDVQGNWIEKFTYQVTLGKNNKVKDRKLEHKISRTIKYF